MKLDPLPVSKIAASSTDDMVLPESQGTHPKTSISTNRRASRAKDMRAKADDIRVDPMEPSPLPSSSPIATSTIIYPATWPESQEADPDQKALANLQAAKTKNLQINATRIGKSPQAVIRPLIEPTLETHQPASFRDEQSAGESEQAPLIRVSIGRIQVLGMPQTPTPTGKRAEAPGPVLSLSEYLAQRRGGTR